MTRTDENGVAIVEPTEPPATVTSRRGFLKFGAAAAGIAAATTATAAVADSQTLQPQPRTPKSQPVAGLPQDASLLWSDPVLRLVRRITSGLSPAEIVNAKSMGYAAYLNYQLNPADIDDSAVDSFIATNLPLMAMNYTQLVTQNADEVSAQLQDAALYRAAFSKRQLLERMVDFWTDHFTVSLNKVGIRKAIDDRDVIRPNALGKFPDLLRATSKSPAMLTYLDQNLSKFPTPNQNYAREVMELHTLGVNGGYTQTDVAELSRILTGWSVSGANYTFNTTSHDRGQNGPKIFLGRTFPTMPATATAAEMRKEGEDALDMLVAHPSTAAYISLKMARWLLAYTPPQDVVDRTTAVYLATGGDIPSMIRTILTPSNLTASVAKYRRPFHLAAASLRALGASVTNIRSIRVSSDGMGMPMFRWDQPNGYPDRIDWWAGLALQRWQFANALSVAANALATNVDLTPFKAQGNTADGVVKVINSQIFGGEIALALQSQLLAYLKAGTFNDARLREGLALAISSQQFQWY
ncbi:MAG: DUF1800 domain-containing protein [Gemmatimonadota bacterium]|nr:DUF1800 domain-containing protein [Gemmatimonadota bacterium]